MHMHMHTHTHTRVNFFLFRRYAFQTEDKLYMVMDYVRGGELYQYLKKFKCFEPERVRLFAAEILLALSYLHDMHFVYSTAPILIAAVVYRVTLLLQLPRPQTRKFTAG